MACALSIQNDTAKNINLSAAVQDFAKAKARIVTFQETTQKAQCLSFHSVLVYINIHTHILIDIWIQEEESNRRLEEITKSGTLCSVFLAKYYGKG